MVIGVVCFIGVHSECARKDRKSQAEEIDWEPHDCDPIMENSKSFELQLTSLQVRVRWPFARG
jgi:hypothetical protein